MKYVNKFDTATQAIAATGLVAPQVVYVQDETKVLYSGNISDNTEVCIRRDNNQLVLKKAYKGLKMTSTGNSTVALAQQGTAPTVDLKYSFDEGDTWTQWDYSAISLTDGQTVCFKGLNNTISSTWSAYNYFVMTGSIAASGNIMSILDDGACTQTSVAYGCFNRLFSGCTSLTTPPELPATTLNQYCYQNMFNGCTALKVVPALPATSVSIYCYSSMFYGCTALKIVPSDLLPATTLVSNCYGGMFTGCTSLTNVPNLPATALGDQCYSSMFSGCTALTSVPSNLLSASNLRFACYSNMFSGCTALTSGPDLPATNLQQICYQYMFNGCTNLNYIKCLATNISASNCTQNWVSGIAATGTFVKAASMTGWTEGTSGIPSGWTVQDAA